MSDTSLKRLNEHLFDTIERLKDSNDPDADQKDIIDVKTAQAINAVAKTIVSTAKLSIDAAKIMAGAKNPENTMKMLSKGIGMGDIAENKIEG